jgi:hypothetical protein
MAAPFAPQERTPNLISPLVTNPPTLNAAKFHPHSDPLENT